MAIGHLTFPCLVGRNGRVHRKREGDGATPVGCWRLLEVHCRRDRLPRPLTALPVRNSKVGEAWCEDPADRRYNRKITRPPGSGDGFWRTDGAFDIVMPTSHNQRPRIRGGGSAIFFHLTREGSVATAGCVALSRRDMLKVLRLCRRVTVLRVWP
ncbi:MAG: L,D-transpeptidase family protein [Rhizobiales bacterium]|nr:L,D-transpeptidase family protein [Hyphomicrobiales bacterium]